MAATNDKNERRDHNRQLLLTQAAGLFARKGYAATSVREIVAAAGVTKPVLYYYFGSKEGLFLALMQACLDRIREILTSFSADKRPARDRIISLADAIYSLAVQELDVTRLVHAIFFTPNAGLPNFDMHALHHLFTAAMTDLVQAGIAEGQLRPEDPEAMTWALVGAIYLAIDAELYHPQATLGREGVARILNAIFTGLMVQEQPKVK